MREGLTAALDDPNVDPSQRLNALSQLLQMEPETRAATAARYLPTLSSDLGKTAHTVQRAQGLAVLAQIYHQIGNTPAAQTAFAHAVESAARIPDVDDRFRQIQSLLSLITPSDPALETQLRRAGMASPQPPLAVPESLRNRTMATALAALESSRASKPGESPHDAIQRLVGTANHGMSPMNAPFTPTILRSLMEQAVSEAKKMSLASRPVSLRLIAMVQARVASLDAVLETLRLSPDREWRVSALLDLASVVDPGFLSPAEQAAQRARLVAAALDEARGFPAGPARYHSLVTVLRATLSTVNVSETGKTGGSHALYREIVGAPRNRSPALWQESRR
jgi:hypothetical protein